MGERISGSAGEAVMILSAADGASWRYSCFNAYEQLRLGGLDCVLCHPGERRVKDEIKRCSVVIFHRTPCDKYISELVREVHRQGAVAIFNFDDLVLDPSQIALVVSPDVRNPVQATLYRGALTRYRETLELCDAVITPNLYLADQTRLLKKPAWVHRDAFSLELLSLSEHAHTQNRREAGRVIVGYASGTHTHDRDFQEAKPALQKVLHKYPQTELWIIGPLDPGNDWGTSNDRIRRMTFVPWRQLPPLLAQFNVNIAPLDIANPFCQAKCEVKYIEAGLVRVPTIASKTEAFEFAIRTGDNGFLATTHQNWIESLDRLVGDATLRQAMGERAHADLLRRYHPVARGHELVTTLNQISEKMRGRPIWPADALGPSGIHPLKQTVVPKIIHLSPALERRPPLWQRTLYAVRYRSPRIFVMQTLVYLQRQLARLLPQGKSKTEARRGG